MTDKDKASEAKVSLQVENVTKDIKGGQLSIHSQKPTAVAPNPGPPPDRKR
jgi:hypothetical protein